VVFNYWDEIGCSTQEVLMNAVTVFEVPKAEFIYEPYDEVTIAHPDVQFLNLTPNIGANTYQWNIADTHTTSEVNPAAQFPKSGEYRITLTATSTDGCKNTTSKILIVKPDFSVFIPNSFTPNDDDLNDTFIPVFSPYGLDPKTFEMEIFDRWGRSLYHTKDATKGWNGTVDNKGADALKQEVYVYKIKYKDLEGKIYNELGHVTLLR
jgi:gliding motility-associated-like protein